MNKATIKAEAIKALESVSGYSYSNSALDAAVEFGIPEGATIMSQQGIKVVREGDSAVGYNDKGEIVKTIPLTGDFADRSAIMYAMRMAQTGHGTGIRV